MSDEVLKAGSSSRSTKVTAVALSAVALVGLAVVTLQGEQSGVSRVSGSDQVIAGGIFPYFA
jgi:hypothetical protein